MLLHGPEDRNILFIEKRDNFVYAVKEFVGGDCAQGGRKKSNFCPF
jgi:hypothetical protein